MDLVAGLSVATLSWGPGNARGPCPSPLVLAGGDQDQGLLVPDLHLGRGWGESKAAQCPWKHEHTEA